MKKLLLSAGLFTALAFTQRSEAQVRVGINFNIGDQPSWRVPGYDYAEYYYLPDIETYYYVPQRQFIYMSNGRWVFSALLPPGYRNYDLHSAHKIVVNRPHAYRYFEQDRNRYSRKNYSQNEGYRRHDNGKHKGWYKQKPKKYRNH